MPRPAPSRAIAVAHPTPASAPPGGGELLAAILSHNLEGGGVLFELPAVIDVARQTLQLRRLGGRVELIAGDFRHEVPAGGDLYLLKILLNWDDEHALRILRNCHRAATPESKLLVIEWLLPGDPEPSGVHLVNLNMLVMLGGKQRSAAEYRQLLEATGYASNRHSNERLELPVEHHRGHPHLATSPP